MPERLSNWQIATIALWALGGATTRTDTEDIAERCYKWAPERFGWKRHPYPDIRVVGEALRDAKKRKNGTLMVGDEKAGGWLLTADGLDWLEQRRSLVERLATSPGRSALSISTDRLLLSVASHGVFAAWRGGAVVTRSDIADALEVTADAPREVLRTRLGTLTNAATVSANPELKEFTAWLQEKLEQLA